MNWISNVVPPKIRSILKRDTPENLWVKCPDSGQLVFHKDLAANLYVVPGSGYHMRCPAKERLTALFDKTKEEVMEVVKKSLRPEFLNRIDEVIMFPPLLKKEVREIVTIQLHILAQRLRKNDIVLKVSPDALEWLSEKGYDPQFGARPVKRVLQKDVLNILSKHLLAGTIDKTAPVVLDMFEGTLVFRKEIEGEKIEDA